MRMVKHWHSREVINTPSTKTFNVRLVGALSNLVKLKISTLWQGRGIDDLKFSFQLKLFYDFMVVFPSPGTGSQVTVRHTWEITLSDFFLHHWYQAYYWLGFQIIHLKFKKPRTQNLRQASTMNFAEPLCVCSTKKSFSFTLPSVRVSLIICRDHNSASVIYANSLVLFRQASFHD